MEKHPVLLICTLPLLCEGLQRIFEKQEDVELVRLECTAPASLLACQQGFLPSIVLIAGEREDDAATHLISSALNRWADVPVVWIELETNVIRMYTSHTLPANSKDLIETIRQAHRGPGHNRGAPGSAQDELRPTLLRR